MRPEETVPPGQVRDKNAPKNAGFRRLAFSAAICRLQVDVAWLFKVNAVRRVLARLRAS
jgi:hypothetical protein